VKGRGTPSRDSLDPLALFETYMRITGVPHLEERPPEAAAGGGELRGRRLGVVNGAAWTGLWAGYFGGLYLPGVQLVNVGNDALQLAFMKAHREGRPCPPRANIELFRQYAEQLVDLARVDAVLLTCSTMNRAYTEVRDALASRNVPVVQIDEPMMEQAVRRGGRILVVATHGPTVRSSQALLMEAADRLGREVSFAGLTVEEAFERLGAGDVRAHNEIVAQAIRSGLEHEEIDTVILAQLSMTVFTLSHPRPEEEFGVPVLTSGETGFRRVREVLGEEREA
jgi:hypothetical protein